MEGKGEEDREGEEKYPCEPMIFIRNFADDDGVGVVALLVHHARHPA